MFVCVYIYIYVYRAYAYTGNINNRNMYLARFCNKARLSTQILTYKGTAPFQELFAYLYYFMVIALVSEVEHPGEYGLSSLPKETRVRGLKAHFIHLLC